MIKYIGYSVIIHVAVVGALSIGMFLPDKKAAAPRTTEGSSSTQERTSAAEAPKKEAKSARPEEATGRKEDYYKREGIDATPAKPDEIPKNPFETEDELKKALQDAD